MELDKESRIFLRNMAGLTAKEERFFAFGDAVTDWLDKRYLCAGFFLFKWFWYVLGFLCVFFVLIPIVKLFDLAAWYISWQYERSGAKSD